MLRRVVGVLYSPVRKPRTPRVASVRFQLMPGVRVRRPFLAFVFLGTTLLTGCAKEPDPYEAPVSFWANPKNGLDSDPCVHATAQAIVKSGLPYPNYGTETVVNARGEEERRIKTIDVWVGPTRFVLPAKIVSSHGGYGTNHPMRYWTLRGSLPNFYPVGEPGPEVDGMGSMVDVTITCSVDPSYVASWGKGYRSNEEGIERIKAKYEESLAPNLRHSGAVSVSVRKDLDMTEVFLDRHTESANRGSWEATYWPLHSAMKGPSGSVSAIGCLRRHAPEKQYGGRAWRCRSSLSITPEANLTIEIYVTQLRHMPAVHAQVKDLFLNAKQN